MRNEIEVMRVMRVPPIGKLVVQVGNQRLQSLADVKDESLKRRLMAAIGELIVFAGGYDTLLDAGVAPPLPRGLGGDMEAKPKEEEALTPEQEAFLMSLEKELKATIQGDPSAAPKDLAELEVRLEAPVTPATPSSSLNLVAEIDDILQKHLARDPEFKNRDIHVEQPAAGTLRIRVDNRYYEHPKEIEETNVRQVIKKALQEWESR